MTNILKDVVQQLERSATNVANKIISLPCVEPRKDRNRTKKFMASKLTKQETVKRERQVLVSILNM